MLRKLVPQIVTAMTTLFSISVAADTLSDSNCAVTPKEIVAKIEKGLTIELPSTKIDRSFILKSNFLSDVQILIGKIVGLQSPDLHESFTYGVWILISEDQSVKSVNGNAKSFSSFPKTSNEIEIKLHETGDLKRARSCIESERIKGSKPVDGKSCPNNKKTRRT